MNMTTTFLSFKKKIKNFQPILQTAKNVKDTFCSTAEYPDDWDLFNFSTSKVRVSFVKLRLWFTQIVINCEYFKSKHLGFYFQIFFRCETKRKFFKQRII